MCFICSHPHSSVVVPWEDNKRRIPSYYPPAGTSRWVGELELILYMYFLAFPEYKYTSKEESNMYIFFQTASMNLSQLKGFLIASSSLLLHRLFLLRVSQSNPKAFVLTLCHHQKIKHFQILPVCISWCYLLKKL